jgi:PBP1b-binding outer membrane lipoprotein LpoB
MRIITIIFSIFFLLGCYTQKKAERSLNKAQINYPELVADKSALWYPCERFKGTSDSTAYKVFIKQIDTLNQLKIDTITKLDTFVNVKLVKDCQEIVWKYRRIYTKLPAIHDTVIMVSTADKYTIKYLENDREESHKRYDRSMKLNIWLLIALMISILMHFFKSFKR